MPAACSSTGWPSAPWAAPIPEPRNPETLTVKLSAPTLALTLALCTLGSGLHAQEAEIRANLGQRIPQLKNIDEVRKTAIPGIYEIRVNGAEILSLIHI